MPQLPEVAEESIDQSAQVQARAAACADLDALGQAISGCEACLRLRRYCQEVAQGKIKRFGEWAYWGRPVPGFGDPAARILILGLAPAAHGANRTGRLFTGDRSGDFLFAALHRAGLASAPTSLHRDDGQALRGVYIAAAARCAPPANKPTPVELGNCRPYLLRELELLKDLQLVLALGGIAHDFYLRMIRETRAVELPLNKLRFAHGALHEVPGAPRLLDCYHVSQQNTFTGVLTDAMMDQIFARARAIVDLP